MDFSDAPILRSPRGPRVPGASPLFPNGILSSNRRSEQQRDTSSPLVTGPPPLESLLDGATEESHALSEEDESDLEQSDLDRPGPEDWLRQLFEREAALQEQESATGEKSNQDNTFRTVDLITMTGSVTIPARALPTLGPLDPAAQQIVSDPEIESWLAEYGWTSPLSDPDEVPRLRDIGLYPEAWKSDLFQECWTWYKEGSMLLTIDTMRRLQKLETRRHRRLRVDEVFQPSVLERYGLLQDVAIFEPQSASRLQSRMGLILASERLSHDTRRCFARAIAYPCRLALSKEHFEAIERVVDFTWGRQLKELTRRDVEAKSWRRHEDDLDMTQGLVRSADLQSGE